MNKLLTNCLSGKYNSKVTVRIILLLISIYIYLFINKSMEFCILLHNIFVSSIILSLMYVNLIKYKFANEIKGSRLKHLNILSILIILLNALSIINLFKYKDLSYFFLLLSSQVIFEYYQLGSIFEIINTKKSSVFIYVMEILVILIANSKHIMSNYVSKEYLVISFVCINSIISLNILVYMLDGIKSNLKRLSKEVVNKMYIYILSASFSFISFIFFKAEYWYLAEILIILKSAIFYNFYNYIISKGVYDSLIMMNKNIDKVTENKKNLNTILRKRNVILNETNIMIQKTQDKYNRLIDSIYGGIFLFSENKLQYFNENTLTGLNIEADDIKNISLEDFVKKYFGITLFGIDLKYDDKTLNESPFAKIKYKGLDIELYLIYAEGQNTLLYVQDVSQTRENIKIKKQFNEYLEVDKLKKEFFANISHELKTPINLIFSAIQVNQIYIKENNLQSLNKNRKTIQQNCLRLIRTINNFIDANKISEGYIIPDFKIYNIVELVENASIASNKYIKLIENTLIFDPDEEEIYVNCDKEMITRIMLNILSNSVKYGKKHGNIKVYVYSEDKEYVVIKVKNDGPRIEKETIPYIFDKFTKLNKAFNRLKEGSGLGLFLTKALVELQGGEIELITNNKGNEFVIRMKKAVNIDEVEIEHEELEMNALEEKVDTEFSDIYIE